MNKSERCNLNVIFGSILTYAFENVLFGSILVCAFENVLDLITMAIQRNSWAVKLMGNKQKSLIPLFRLTVNFIEMYVLKSVITEEQ